MTLQCGKSAIAQQLTLSRTSFTQGTSPHWHADLLLYRLSEPSERREKRFRQHNRKQLSKRARRTSGNLCKPAAEHERGLKIEGLGDLSVCYAAHATDAGKAGSVVEKGGGGR